MTDLAAVFERILPGLLAAAPAAARAATIGFVVQSGPAAGYWVILPHQRQCRRGTRRDDADVVVEADAAVLEAFFAGALQVAPAVARGALRIQGDAGALEVLAELLRAPPA